MRSGAAITNSQQLNERLIALKAKREVHEAQLLETSRTVLRPAAIVKGIIQDLASERKVALDLLRIGSGVLSGVVGAKAGVIGKGAMVADLLIKAVSSFRKKKGSDTA